MAAQVCHRSFEMPGKAPWQALCLISQRPRQDALSLAHHRGNDIAGRGDAINQATALPGKPRHPVQITGHRPQRSPAAPSASAATNPPPVANPPEAKTGTFTAATICANSTNEVTRPRSWPSATGQENQRVPLGRSTALHGA